MARQIEDGPVEIKTLKENTRGRHGLLKEIKEETNNNDITIAAQHGEIYRQVTRASATSCSTTEGAG